MSDNGLSEEQWEILKTNGALYLPGLLDVNEIRQLKQCEANLRKELPYGYVYGKEYSRTNPQKQETEPPLDPLQVMPVFYSGFRESFIHQLFAQPKIYDGFERLLGKDFVLINAIVHTVRPGTQRLPIHKDAHGMALAVVLLDDCGWDSGGTSFKAGTHVNSPPPAFCLEDVRAPMPGERQTTGKAGDVYILSVDAWHGRAANTGSNPTSKLMMHVDSRTNLHGPHWVHAYSEGKIAGARSKLPEFARHLLEWSQDETEERQRAKAAMGRLERWALSDGNMCQTATRSLVYFMLNSRRGEFPNGRGQRLPAFTSTPMLIQPFRPLAYLKALKLKLILRSVLGKIIRALPGGNALISALRS